MSMASQQRQRGRRHGTCPCCNRELDLTFHHLVPKKLHRRSHFKRHYTKAQLAEGVYICRRCHDGIHRRFDEMFLARHLATLDELLKDPDLQRHFEWVARQRVPRQR